MGGLIEEHIKRSSVRTHSLNGYYNLTDMVKIHLESSEGRNKFEDSTILDQVKRDKDKHKEAKEYFADVTMIDNRTKDRGYFTKWDSERKSEAKMRENYEKFGLGHVTYNPAEMIVKFGKSERLRSCFRKMVTLADAISGGEPVKIEKGFIIEMNKLLPAKFMETQGIRPELLANLKRGEVAWAVTEVANPNKPVHLDPKSNMDALKDRMMGNDYMGRQEEDITGVDPLDPSPDQKSEFWEILKGYSIEAGPSKTGHKYKQFLWFNQYGKFHLDCYILITNEYLEDIGVTVNYDTPVFVNTKGESLTTGKCGFDLTAYREITGLLKAQAMMYRKTYSNTLFVDAETYATGHLPTTVRTHYIDSATALSRTIYANEVYKRLIGLEELSQPFVATMGPKAQLRDARFRKQKHEEDETNILKVQKKIDNEQQITRSKAYGVNQTIALIELVSECESNYFHDVMLGQNVLEAFLITYKTRRTSIKHSTAVLRMLDMCPESSVPRRALLDHFIERSVIFWEEPENDEDDMFTDTSIRKLELDWASSLLKNLNQIGKQSTAMAVRNQRLMGALEEICNRKNSYNFTL